MKDAERISVYNYGKRRVGGCTTNGGNGKKSGEGKEGRKVT